MGREIDFRKSPRFSLTSPLSQVALFLLCVMSPVVHCIRIIYAGIDLKVVRSILVSLNEHIDIANVQADVFCQFCSFDDLLLKKNVSKVTILRF